MSAPLHEEERDTIWVFDRFIDEHPGCRYVFTFAEGDSYLCEFGTEFDDDNDLDEDDPYFDEYVSLWMDVIKVLAPGPNVQDTMVGDRVLKDSALLVNYSNFPASITTEEGEQVYPKP